MLGIDKTTGLGFQKVAFMDDHLKPCSIQCSSAIDGTDRGFEHPGSSFLWLGIDSQDRMHLSRSDVAGLIERMQQWLDCGSFVPEGK